MIGSYEVYGNYAPFFLPTMGGAIIALLLVGLVMLRMLIKRVDRLEEKVNAIARK